jgi:hypothetical protein
MFTTEREREREREREMIFVNNVFKPWFIVRTNDMCTFLLGFYSLISN